MTHNSNKHFHQAQSNMEPGNYEKYLANSANGNLSVIKNTTEKQTAIRIREKRDEQCENGQKMEQHVDVVAAAFRGRR